MYVRVSLQTYGRFDTYMRRHARRHVCACTGASVPMRMREGACARILTVPLVRSTGRHTHMRTHTRTRMRSNASLRIRMRTYACMHMFMYACTVLVRSRTYACIRV
jgi:hypothetical protein